MNWQQVILIWIYLRKQTIIEMLTIVQSYLHSHAKEVFGNDESKSYLQPDKHETVKEKIL